jgi:hypothetical protein
VFDQTAYHYLRRGKAMPQSITIPEVDDSTASWLVAEAGRQGVSVETVAGQLLQRGLEWERRRAELPAYHDLDALAGTWSKEDAAAFVQAVANSEHVDPSLWP